MRKKVQQRSPRTIEMHGTLKFFLGGGCLDQSDRQIRHTKNWRTALIIMYCNSGTKSYLRLVKETITDQSVEPRPQVDHSTKKLPSLHSPRYISRKLL